ncbi:TonB family protein, partial [Calditrichota bacterium]
KDTRFTRESMAATINKRSEALYRIYQQMEIEQPELRGSLSLHFYVNPDGSVSEVELVDSQWDGVSGEALQDSVIVHVKQWTFPPGAPKPVGITQPWVFEPH